MGAFKGITYEYRQSEEYKMLYGMIKDEHPDMPQYLIDMAISVHKTNPKLYKEYSKPVEKQQEKFDSVIHGAVKIYDDPEEVPEAIPAKFVEYPTF